MSYASSSPLLIILTGLRRIGRNFSTMLKIALLPFFISIGVVIIAREIGPPTRYLLDAVHGVVVIFYLSAVIKLAPGTAPTGWQRFGFAAPAVKSIAKITQWKNTFSLIIAAAIVLMPTALVIGLLFRRVESLLNASDAIWFETPSHIIPEFIMTMLLGGLMSATYNKASKAKAKICGINSRAALEAAVDGGAVMLGFVFFPPSPRAVTTVEAGELMAMVPDGILKVALMVDPSDQDISAITKALPIDVIQLHGAETPARTAEVKALSGLQVFKAVAISTPEDIKLAHEFEASCDGLLLDGKAPMDATRPGGNAISFDWGLISGETWEKPWLLAGGLTAQNVGNAIAITGAPMVDVSSGVEDAPGVKNPAKITIFLGAVEDGG